MGTRIRLTNGFQNANGIGILLTAELLKGAVEIRDNLLMPDGTKVSILEIEDISLDASREQVALTVPIQIESKLKWSELYGTEIEIEKKHYRQHSINPMLLKGHEFGYR